jgi:hypothetical protein
MNVTVKEMTTKEILDRLEEAARTRLGMSAEEFIRDYNQGKIECPGAFADMLALIRLIPKNHPILAK